MNQAVETLEYLKTAPTWSDVDVEAWAMVRLQLGRSAARFEEHYRHIDAETRRHKVYLRLWDNIRYVSLDLGAELLNNISPDCRRLLAQTWLHLLCWAKSSSVLARCSVSNVLVYIERLIIPTWEGKSHSPEVARRLYTELEIHLVGDEECLMNPDKVAVDPKDTGSSEHLSILEELLRY